MYDFPASPTENQEFTPPGAEQTYIYKAPRWLVKGIPPVGGGGTGGGIGEAPEDGQQYARQNADWSVVEGGVSDWADIENKPATFPPTVPIPWTDVSGKPSTFPPTLPIGWSDVSGKPATFPPTLPIPWTDVSGKPATFPPDAHVHAFADITGKPATYPPTLPIAQSGITNLTTDLAAKAPLVHTHPQSDITNLTTDLAGKASTVHTHAQADVTGLVAGQAAQDTAIAGKVAKTGDTMTGGLNFYPGTGTSARITLNKATVGDSVMLEGRSNNSVRWRVVPGNTTAESGGDAGSDFSIDRFSDAGAYLDSPFSIMRNTGQALVKGDPTSPLGVAPKQYVDAQAGASLSRSPGHFNFKFDSATVITGIAAGEIRVNAAAGSVTHIFVANESLDTGDGNALYSLLVPGNKILFESKTDRSKWQCHTIQSVAYAGTYDLTVKPDNGGLLPADDELVTVQIMYGLGPLISDTAPVGATGIPAGLLWWNSDTGNLYINYYDGSSWQWVQVNTVGT